MNFKKVEIEELIGQRHNGNYRDFAIAIGLNYVTVYRVLTGRRLPGNKFIAAFMAYCKLYGLDFNHYIFLG